MVANRHFDNCECAVCKYGPEKVIEIEQECLQKLGWYAHMVPGNYHTHGLPASFNHPDIQVVLQIDPHTIHSVVGWIVDQIREGDKFLPGLRYSKVIKNMDVTFIEATEGGRSVLRLIFPDPQGNLEQESMASDFTTQYDP